MTDTIRNTGQFLTHLLRHPIGVRRPVATLFRVAKWQIESRLRPGLHDKPWIGGSRLLVKRGMTGATGNLYYGLHEFTDMAFLLHFLRPEDLLLDIGANVGTYTVLAAKCIGAQVVAFEPHPETSASLQRNVEHNGIADRVTIQHVGLSDRSGSGAMTDGFDTTNRVVDASEGGSRSIELRTLDSIVGDQSPIMLKIDVEGHEPQVLAGATATLARPSLQAIEIETIDADTDALLREAGFAERYYDPFTRTISAQRNGPSASNRLYLRDEALVAERVRTARQFAVGGIAL